LNANGRIIAGLEGGQKVDKKASLSQSSHLEILEDQNYLDALNIFMLLNENNDGYIQYDETQ
jgi:hypothetical protein